MSTETEREATPGGSAPPVFPEGSGVEFFFDYAAMAHDSGPGHPESAARLSALRPLFDRRVEEGRGRWLDPSPDPDLSLYREIHAGDYIDFLETLPPGSPPVPIDGDTQVSRATVTSLEEIAGAVRELSVSRNPVRRKVFCAVRPPGHHAQARGGMGFCVVNHVALLCALRLRSCPEERILILDFDVHHGNGTGDIVSHLPPDRVLFVSTHRFPFYPGTGSGKGNTEQPGGGGILDIPLPARTDDRDYRKVLEERIIPRWERFSPGTVLVSAGFDAHALDPLGDMNLTEDSFELLGTELGRRQQGLAVAFLEGGYNLSALARSVDAFLRGWEKE